MTFAAGRWMPISIQLDMEKGKAAISINDKKVNALTFDPTTLGKNLTFKTDNEVSASLRNVSMKSQ